MAWLPPAFGGAVHWVDNQAPSLDSVNLNLSENEEAAFSIQVGQSIVDRYEPRTVISVKDPDFGAKGDGIANDTNQITNAIITAAGSIAGQNGRVVFLPAGVYMVNAALLMKFGVHLVGEGSRNTVIKAISSGTFTNGSRSAFPAMMKWDGGDPWAHGVRVHGIHFDTNNVAGLSATWFQAPGELSSFNDLTCNSTASLPRTVNDAQITAGSSIITFTSSTFTDDDVNAILTHSALQVNTKIDRINYTDPYAYPPQTTATSITLSKPAISSVSNATLSIPRPTDAFVFDMAIGGAARGYIGSLNGVTNSGALLRFKNFSGGTFYAESLSGDDNMGGMFRCSLAGNAADPCHMTIGQIKSEKDVYDPVQFPAMMGMDPVILLDRCATLALNIGGGSFLGNGERDVIRIDYPWKTTGNGPSIRISGAEGQNWFNTAYTNIIRDSSTGETFPASSYGPYNHSPEILWGRDLLLGGGAKIPMLEKWESGGVYYSKPVWNNCNATPASSQGSAIPFGGGIVWYNLANAQFDSMSWLDDLSPGTYDLALAGTIGANQAIAIIETGIHVWSPPSIAPNVTQPAAGTFPAGTNYPVYYTYVTANGESYPSPVRFFTTDGAHNVVISSPPSPPPYFMNNPIIGWYAYVGAAGTSTPAYRQQVAGSPIPLGVNFTISGAPVTAGTGLPRTDTSGSWNAAASWDQYNATSSLWIQQFTGIVIPRHNGPIRLRFTANARNSSNTTGWLIQISGRHWQRIT